MQQFTCGNSIQLHSIQFNLWCRGVVVIITAQLHSTNPELKFCAGSNPARSVSRWWGFLAMAPAGNKAKRLSLVNHTTKTIYHHHHHHHHHHYHHIKNRKFFVKPESFRHHKSKCFWQNEKKAYVLTFSNTSFLWIKTTHLGKRLFM